MRSSLASIAMLTFPVWGTAAAVGLIILLNSERASGLVVVAGVILVALSSAPILASPNLSRVAKIALTAAYFLISAIVVIGLGLLLLCMHKCN